jgi:hypothetical protein
MGGINAGRVILGGLLAGLVINIGETILNVLVLPQAMEDLLRAGNLPVLGGSASATVLMGIYPAHVAAIGVVWRLVEIVLASISSAWFYTE